MSKGIFITIEGIDGAGKSTQIDTIYQYFVERGREVVVTREPGGTPLAEDIRNLLLHKKEYGMDALTELLLYQASRVEHVKSVINPSLKECKVVICSRFTHSSLAYQGYGLGMDLEMIDNLNMIASKGVSPNLVFVIDISPEEMNARFCARGDVRDRIESRDFYYFQRVREGFLAMAKSNDNIIVIDGALKISQVKEKVINTLESLNLTE